MHEGLRAVSIPFGYSNTWLVGRLERAQGDEYTLKGVRILSLGSNTHEDVLKNGTDSVSKITTWHLHRLQMIMIVGGEDLGESWGKYA